MRRSERLFMDREHLVLERLGFLVLAVPRRSLGARRKLVGFAGELALVVEHAAKVGKHRGGARVVAAQLFFQYRGGALEQRLGAGVVALLFEHQREAIQGRGRVLMVRTQPTLVERQHPAKIAFCLVELALAQMRAAEQAERGADVWMVRTEDADVLLQQG